MDIERVAIIGRGALGILYTDLIAGSLGGEAVAFAMDRERYERCAGRPVRVNGAERLFNTVCVDEVARPVDLLVFAVKAPALAGAIELAAPLVGPQTRIASLLNGITSEERIAARYGWTNLPLCVAQGMDAVRFGDALTYSCAGQLRFGAAPGTDPQAVADLAAFCERAGVPYVVEADIRHRQWSKFMLNVGVNQTCMVFGGTYGSVCADGTQWRTMVAAMREVVAVANAEGVALTETDLAGMAGLIPGLDPDGMPSMAQDRLAGRPSEVEEFAGQVVARAARHGILVPTNEWLYQQVHQIEAGYGQS